MKRIKKIKRDNNIIDLSTNEAAYGRFKKYPNTVLLREKLAEKKNISIDNLLLTRGSEEGIKMVFDQYLKKGDSVIRPEPTFGMLEVYEYIKKLKVDKINYDKNFNIDILCKLRRKHKLLYIANPDNPTGSYNKKINLILKRCNDFNIKVILDLVYHSYYNNNDDYYERGLMQDYKNLFIVNSFSKSYGLAGLRSGYIISNKKNIEKLEMLSPMQEINSVAVSETLKVIEDESVFLKNLENVKKWKLIFMRDFLNYFIDTETNFISLRINSFHILHESKRILLDNGIKVKILSGHPSINNILRITIGQDSVMKVVRKILLELLHD